MSGTTRPHFLRDAPSSPQAEALVDADRRDRGFVMNLTQLWAYQPESKVALFALLEQVASAGGLSERQLRVLVPAAASTLGDSYCSVAWGSRLAAVSDPGTAAGVIRGDDQGLDDAERAMAHWARTIVRNPSATTAADVDALRLAGFTDAQIFAVTAFVALRVAFSTINGALGAAPDAAFATSAPAEVVGAITYGRPIGA